MGSIPDAGGPLWILDLTLRDYIHWTRPAQIQVCADRDFREEENPHAITWAVWDVIIHDELDTDESGTIPIVEGVRMIKCDTTVVFCEDGVGRPCFVVWIQEESTGRERHVALAQFRYRPRVQRWPAIPDPNVPERPLSNPQATSKAAPARNPVAHDAVSASVGGVPPAKAPTVPNAPPLRNTDPQRTSSSTSSTSEQPQGYPRAAQACSSSVHDDERCVLADTGANELIRPAGVQPPMRSTKVHLTLADGNTTFAWRTRDGELAMQGEESSWIAPVGKLVELGYKFIWDLESGARLVRDTEAVPEIIRMFVDNGLPYIYWSDFVYLRKQLSAAYRSSRKSCCAVDSGASKPVNQFMSPEDLQACESDHQESSAQGIKAGIGETVAANFLKLQRITYDNILEAVMKAELKPQRKSRDCAVGFEESKGVESWVFGAYGHGPKCGLTSRTTQYPNLVTLINRFMKQELPTATWSSFSVSRDVTFTPHRDLHNEPGSQNILVVLNHKGQCKGGSLWIEHEDGDQVRQVKPDLSLNGVVLPVLRHPVQFNPAKWHGTTPWKGSRTSLSFFTTKNAAALSNDEQQCLRELQFPTCAAAAAVTMHDVIPSDPKSSLNPSAEDSEARTADATTGEFREFREHKCDGDQDGLSVGDDLQGLGNADGPPARSDQQILEDELAEYEPSFADPDDIFNECSGDVSIDGLRPLGSDVSCPGPEQGRRKEIAKDKPGHTLDDYKARGNKKPHRRVQPSDVARGVLSIDIAGPYKGAYDDSKYILAGVFRLEDGATLQFVQPLQRRFWSDVLIGVRAILNELSAIAGGHAPVRIHSDRAKEFLAQRVVEEIKGAGIHQTCTVGHDPAANGVAERNIGLLKQRVREFLIKGEAPSKYWPILFQEAARQQRDLTLGKSWQGQVPYPGDHVAVKINDPGPLDVRSEAGIFLGRADRFTNGAYVEVRRNGRSTVVVSRLPAVIKEPERRWRTYESLSGDLLWVSNDGHVRDADTIRDLGIDLGLLTVEEVLGGQSPLEGYPLAAVATASQQQDKQPAPEHGDKSVNWQKYHLLSYEEEQLGNQIEEKLLEASIAPAQAETVDLKGFYKGDRQEQWKNSLIKEYGKMKDVLEETPRGQLRERLPREIPSKVVATLKPSDDANLVNEDGFAEKSRICACGNFESGADNNGEPWSSSNIPPEIVRTFVSLAASTKTWTLGGLDVEAAFLNADISSGDPVIITPLKLMRDLGLVSEDTVWIARKNIYGLRRGPTEWETERDTKLNHTTIKPSKDDKHSALTFVPINLAAGLWKLVDERGVVVGACCCYVDDGLVVGDIEVIRRVTAYIQGVWAIKGQGVLTKPGVNLHEDLVVSESLSLKRVQCTRFLGTEIAVAGDGLQIGQAKYVAQELRARGWLALKGSESLPVPSEGLAGPEIRDNAFEANMKLAQKEAGTLMWIALRSRPDIAACLGIASTMITSRPSESLRLCKGIWRYLRCTWDKLLHYSYGGDPGNRDQTGKDDVTFRIVSDASLAPGGARSRSGIALFLGNHLLSWKSQRQSIVAWSATESEIEGYSNRDSRRHQIACST